MEDRDTDASAIERNLERYNYYVRCGIEKKDLEQMLKNEEISACHK